MSRWAFSPEGTEKCPIVVGIMYNTLPGVGFRRLISPARLEMTDGSVVEVGMVLMENFNDVKEAADNIEEFIKLTAGSKK